MFRHGSPCYGASCALFALLLLQASCASRVSVPGSSRDWEAHHEAVAELGVWALAGRLNVRQGRQSDTVLINWEQRDPSFDLRLSGSFGLGAVHVHGSPALVTVEQSGEPAQQLPGLDALTRDYFGYEFPTAQLLYWVRGIPAPQLPMRITLDAEGRLASLTQTDAAGLDWTLSYDRYQDVDSIALPGRIRVLRDGLQLTFLISDWDLPQQP